MLLGRPDACALALFLAAGLSDGLNGFFAKHYGLQLRLGSILDPLADQVVLFAWILVLESSLPIPVWLVVAAAARDPLIAGVPLLYTHRDEELEAHSRRLTHGQHPAPDPAGGLRDRRRQAYGPSIVDALVWAVLASILVSGALYVSVWGRKARQTDLNGG